MVKHRWCEALLEILQGLETKHRVACVSGLDTPVGLFHQGTVVIDSCVDAFPNLVKKTTRDAVLAGYA